MLANKRGGVGKEWLYAISFLFSLSILVFIFNTVFNYNLAPLFIELLPDAPVGVEAEAGINQWLTFWKFIPLLLFGSVIIYMFILSVKKTPEEKYYG